MKTLSINYPESVLATMNVSPEVFEKEVKIALAVKLYELGRLTSGQAAALIGIKRAAFLLNCQNYGSTTIQWDKEELAAEFSGKSL